MGTALSPAERLARLRLARSENVGPVTFRDLLQHFGNALDALDALPTLAARRLEAPPEDRTSRRRGSGNGRHRENGR